MQTQDTGHRRQAMSSRRVEPAVAWHVLLVHWVNWVLLLLVLPLLLLSYCCWSVLQVLLLLLLLLLAQGLLLLLLMLLLLLQVCSPTHLPLARRRLSSGP